MKLNPNESINIGSAARILARGEPYNYIIFTDAEDNACGEPLPAPPSGWPYRLINIGSSSSSSSVVQYCKMGHATIGVNFQGLPVLDEPIANNTIWDMNAGVCIYNSPVVCHNNLIVDCIWGVIVSTTAGSNCTNNTIDDCIYGIETYKTSGGNVSENLLTTCVYGIYCSYYTGPDINIHHNGFHGNVYNFYSVDGSVHLGEGNQFVGVNPYRQSGIGGYLLDTTQNEVNQKLINKGSRSAEDAGLADQVFTVNAPETVESGGHYTDEDWTKVDTEEPLSLVDIGYHHNRVDRYVAGDAGFSGGASLTISPGVVVAIASHAYSFWLYTDAKLTCVGDALTEGYNLITESRPVSMQMESPQFASWGSPSFIIYGVASDELGIRFTRFAWLTYGIHTYRTLPGAINDNIFVLNGVGVVSDCCPNIVRNNLFYRNWAGVAAWDSDCNSFNNTFDTNNIGIYYQRSANRSLTAVDNLFSDFTLASISPQPEREGISLYGAGAAGLVENYNAYYNLAHDIYDHQSGSEVAIGLESRHLGQSPYDGKRAGSEASWFLRQSPDGPTDLIAVDCGSRSAKYAGLSCYTTSTSADKDVKDVDIGYHHSHGDFADTDDDGMPDPWEQKWFGGLSQLPDSDYDSDGVNNVLEYEEGTKPTLADTDGDGLTDRQEFIRGGGGAEPNLKGGPYLIDQSYTGKAGIRVRWYSTDSYTGSLRYRVETQGAWSPVKSETSATKFHSILLTNLTPGAVYFYEVGRWVNSAHTKLYGTRQFRVPSPTSTEFKFLVYGDNRWDAIGWGSAESTVMHKYHAAVARSMLQDTADAAFVLHVGDLVESGGTEAQWCPQLLQPAACVYETVPIFACIGNHEAAGDPGTPTEWTGTYFDEFFFKSRWYSFDYRGCHFVCLDTNNYEWFDQSSDAQRVWLSNDLPKWAGKRVFVWFHQPPYSTARGGDEYVRTYLVPIFEDPSNDVRMVFNGHDHFYERNEKEGITYVITGGAGAPLNADPWSYPGNPPGGATCLAREGWFHYSRVAVSPTDIGLAATHDSGVPLDIVGEAEHAKTFGLGEGVSWFYNDSGQGLGTAWKDPGYSHSWPSANAPLGFGEGQTPQLQRAYVTYYFRKEGVSINGFGDAEQIAIKVRCDDGCVVYVNGQEAFRHNMPVESLDWQTKAPYSVGEEVGDSWMENSRSFNRYIVARELFAATNNTIAIEVHQSEKDMVKPAAQRDLNIDLGLRTWY